MDDQENPQFQQPDYLGDGVYAGHDGFQIWLHANDHRNPTDRIALDYRVYKSLKLYADRLGWNK
jgi:hypothetical protein